MKPRVKLLLLAAWFAACPAPTTPDPIIVPPPPEQLVLDHWTPVAALDAGAGRVGPVPVGRVSRRLTVQQLDATLRMLAGDGWSLQASIETAERFPDGGAQGSGPISVDALIFLGAGMGHADYLTEFRETTDVTPTFAKLMDNWASHQCVVMVLHDFTTTDAGARLFAAQIPDEALLADGGSPAARRAVVLENLRRARLHFQGVYTAPERAEAELGSLADVVDAVSLRRRAETQPEPDGGARRRYTDQLSDLAGFGAACTLILTDPEFVTY